MIVDVTPVSKLCLDHLVYESNSTEHIGLYITTEKTNNNAKTKPNTQKSKQENHNIETPHTQTNFKHLGKSRF